MDFAASPSVPESLWRNAESTWLTGCSGIPREYKVGIWEMSWTRHDGRSYVRMSNTS